MSGMWFMVGHGAKSGEAVVTSHVEGLDKLRRQTRRQMAVSGLLAGLYAGSLVAILWGKVPWWMIAANVGMLMTLTILGILAGISLGRLSAFRDLSRAHVKATVVDLEGDGHV